MQKIIQDKSRRILVPKDDFHLEEKLENESTIILRLKSRINSLRFGSLVDEELFYKVTTDDSYIR